MPGPGFIEEYLPAFAALVAQANDPPSSGFGRWLALDCGNQATTYNNRERRRIWSSRPSSWLIASSVADTSIACILAVAGIAMAPLPLLVVAGALGGAVVFALLMDVVKVPLFRRLSLT